jgi:hypothetical protein
MTIHTLSHRRALGALLTLMLAAACTGDGAPAAEGSTRSSTSPMHDRLAKYTPVRLTADLSTLSERERQMIPLLIDAARAMDAVYWEEAYGSQQDLMRKINDRETRRFAEINYGPWDRLEGNVSFVNGVGAKPKGANFYPVDMDTAEFAAAAKAPGGDLLKSQYTLVRRDSARKLVAIRYRDAFARHVGVAAEKLRAAAKLADDPGLKNYLELRAEALITDDYQPSDLAWMDMKNNTIDVVIGPIETYEDQLFGYKASHEAFILIKDREWSQRLARYTTMLPELQRGLPVPAKYKAETPGTDSDLNAYDAVYYAGDANAGSKTIAINLPNDEEVQLKRGTRRLQLKNSMRAKFDKILVPVADVLIAEDQRKHVSFDAFFSNVMFHEVAHGLGIKNILSGKGTVREALKEHASSLEEGKADVLGFYMVTKLHEKGELGQADLMDNYVTFLAGIFRSVRFGASSAHGRANMAAFNFFQDRGAFTRDAASGTYRVDFDKMTAAMTALSEQILRFQGDGDYAGVARFNTEMGIIRPELQKDLARLESAGIPVDIIFQQGMDVLR